jgi:hypothetical protein
MFAWRLYYQRNKVLLMHIRAGLALFAVTLFFTMPAPGFVLAFVEAADASPAVVISTQVVWMPAPADLAPLFSAEPLERADVPLSFGRYRPI